MVYYQKNHYMNLLYNHYEDKESTQLFILSLLPNPNESF